ncbi:uncharacterized protein BCR38DRAFT_348410 [Pseudomassariella vexata]|uniref:ARID domain-containing protein n=1 Tax=Pseudomassariella vexata TaxID=1141098 RepID=A0A1Y2DQ21_9PEZI|nr:uncharacterized protein BCR38DRAFT_348410 [Pseudomassariella vexata]ORY61350.1 hypothetical protein BCR38DRAFT_348410 [Pseudomassariella vexata]
MAPKGSPAKKPYIHEIDRTAEYDDFIKKLAAFHEKRGTSFEPEPRLQTQYGHITVDLLKLYKAVVAKGGYDELGKVQKAWAALATELGMHYEDSKNMGQLSFQLKQDFYKYLVAFWVRDQYSKEPPPPEILEQQSCASKYGPVLTRTLESFKLVTKRSGDETPAKEDRISENTPVSGNRASGRLREAPPQRVPFQPETGPSRSTRHSSSHHGTPSANTPHNSQMSHGQHPQHYVPQRHDGNNMNIMQAHQAAMHGASHSFTPPNSENASKLSETVKSPTQISVPLRPVHPPATLTTGQVQAARNEARRQFESRFKPPGANFDGPNIYARCLQSLRSGIPAEEKFALYHLVKISFERWDKFKFEAFHGLAEGLIEMALQVGSLFYNVDWQIGYSGNESDPDVLDGTNGTDDILKRIEKLTPKVVLDNMQPAHFTDRMTLITEALLTIRNMVTLPDNAKYAVDIMPLKDLLCIVLHLPSLEMLVELKHSALDIAEHLTPYMNIDSQDPLYQTLLSQLSSTDRGTVLTALRAISRISMNFDVANKLQNVPPEILQNVMNWLLLNDEELMDACLDFLYMYTAVVPNVESLLKAVNVERLVPHLVRLLGYGAKRIKEDVVLVPPRKIPAGEDVAALPQDLLERLANTEEPQRCFQWLQSLFEEDSDSHITQIAIWHAYQSSFGSLSARNTLTAADFIRNVSHVFANARAQIIRGAGEAPRFIIEGIRARLLPLNFETKEEYLQCHWVTARAPFAQKCGKFFLGGENMWKHILTAHLGQMVREDGSAENKELDISCQWSGCSKYTIPSKMSLLELTGHVKTHFPSGQKRGLSDVTDPVAKRHRPAHIVPVKTMTLAWECTPTTKDDRNPQIEQAAGIPLSAVLVLRNIARNVVKTESQEELLNKEETGGESGGWNEKLFRPVMARLFEVMTENKAMAPYIASLLQLVQRDYEVNPDA